jgi:hypothetical protein
MKSKAGEDCYAAGWAHPHTGGIMCPKCYDQLMALRAKYDMLKAEAIRTWMAKGKP